MPRFKITRNINREQKQLLQAKIEASLVEEVNLLCKWSGNEKSHRGTSPLRAKPGVRFQEYKQSLAGGARFILR